MINWARIHELREEIGAESFDEVAELFLAEADSAVAQLRDDLDPGSLESALHFLKGSALNLGFSDLAALCQDGERQAAGGSCDVNLGDIRSSYHASTAAFAAGRSIALSA